MRALFAPTVVVNSVAIGIKPNSFSYKDGLGERNVRVASVGGGGTETIVSENIETQQGVCTFTLFSTDANAKLIRQWLFNRENNSVEVTDKGGFSRTFLKAIVVNDPEIALGQDADVEVEFQSQRAV